MARKKKRPAKAKPRQRWWTALQVALIAGLGFAAYGLWLDQVVRDKFEGARWALPARVFARPLELYVGAKVGPTSLRGELDLLGYQGVSKISGPGQFRRVGGPGSVLQIATRGHDFGAGLEPARTLEVGWSGAHIKSLLQLPGGQPLPLARLEPMEIAKIIPRHAEDRLLVRIDQVPTALIDAVLATEDRRFYQHHGVDIVAIARAFLANLRAGELRQGGSTVTQQLVKNFYLTHERTWWRKLNEIAMALLLEWHYSKDAILEAYLNEIFLGQNGHRAIHGFGLAARFYFNTPLAELKPEQLALLVGLARGASYYDPRRHPERARARRNLVLDLMVENEKLASRLAVQSKRQPLRIARRPASVIRFPAFVDVVRLQLRRDYAVRDLHQAGLRIYTTLDPRRQIRAQQLTESVLQDIEKKEKISRSGTNAAVVLLGAENGELQAFVGARDAYSHGFNRALNAQRQIGSLIKPAVFLTALMSPHNYHPLSRLDDRPVAWRGDNGELWEPQNYDKQIHGDVTLGAALANSYNLATVQLGLAIKVDNVVKTLHKLGVDRPLPVYPSLLLGAVEFTPLEVASMYQTLANGGFRAPVRAVRSVVTANGTVLQQYPLKIEQALPAAPIFVLNQLLSKVIEHGTGKTLLPGLRSYLPLAGKTGTSDDLRDSWFAGFSRDEVLVVWMGRDDNQPAGLTGGAGAGRLWGRMMVELAPSPLPTTPPAGVQWHAVDLAAAAWIANPCPASERLPFVLPLPDLPRKHVPCAGAQAWRAGP